MNTINDGPKPGNPIPKIDRGLAELFLSVLAPGTERFTFQTFTDCTAKREYKAKRIRDPLARILHGSLAERWDELVALSLAGAGIYVTVNETDLRGRSAAHIKRVRAHFVDQDGAPLANVLRMMLCPHFVVQSSPRRYHAYWIVDGARLEDFKPTQQRLAGLMDGDLTVCDLPRVMRLAGFSHQKDPTRPFLVTIGPVESAPPSPYSAAEFQAALAAAEGARLNSSSPRNFTEGLAALLGNPPPDMRQGYPDGQRTRELTRRAGYCLGPWNMSEEQAVQACLEWNRHNNPPQSDEKVRLTVASIAKTDARNCKASQQKEATADDTKASNGERGDGKDEPPRDPPQRERLILIGLEAELWHDKDGNAFATAKISDHRETFPVKSTAFRHWLTREYGSRFPFKIAGKTCPSAPSVQALTEAINALGAKAATGPERQAGVRIAGHDGSIFLDLGTPEWTVVEISADGWRITSEAPVRFVRPAGLRALPVPARGGSIMELKPFLNAATDSDFVLIVSWLLAALRPTGPYPVLIINGEQGAGKSMTCRVVRRLIDPNGAELRNDTRDERDLLLAAKNGWIVALDNLSYVRNDLSDAICRIATKGGFATRTLYTNDEEFLLEVCRPVLLNGIPPLASRADLTDRAIVCVLPTIAEADRRTEEEFWSAFTAAAPRLLGALLEGVSGAMRIYASVQLKHSYRMQDFAKWAEAACQALGSQAGTFEAAYRQNRSSTNEEAVEADPVAGAVVDLMSANGGFKGTATELLWELERHVSPTQRDRRWPKDPTRLSSHLRRVPPLLRPRGIEIDFGRTVDAARRRIITIKRVDQK